MNAATAAAYDEKIPLPVCVSVRLFIQTTTEKCTSKSVIFFSLSFLCLHAHFVHVKAIVFFIFFNDFSFVNCKIIKNYDLNLCSDSNCTVENKWKNIFTKAANSKHGISLKCNGLMHSFLANMLHKERNRIRKFSAWKMQRAQFIQNYTLKASRNNLIDAPMRRTLITSIYNFLLQHLIFASVFCSSLLPHMNISVDFLSNAFGCLKIYYSEIEVSVAFFWVKNEWKSREREREKSRFHFFDAVTNVFRLKDNFFTL